MLGKVMKYEFRASGRMLLPFFGLTLAGSGLMRFLIWLASKLWEPARELLGSLVVLAGVLLVLAVILIGFVAAIVRFYQSMVTDEGYLTYTLPVKTNTHIAGRLIVGSLYSLLGFLVALLCASILIPSFWTGVLNATIFSTGNTVSVTGPGSMAIAGNSDNVLSVALNQLPANLVWSIVGILLIFAVLTVVTNLVKAYASVAIGPRITKNKLLGSIVGYVIINAAQGIIMLFLMLIPAFAIIGSSSDDLARYFQGLLSADPFTSLGNLLGVLWGFVGIIAAISLAFAAVEYWLSWYFLDKKLNLE